MDNKKPRILLDHPPPGGQELGWGDGGVRRRLLAVIAVWGGEGGNGGIATGNYLGKTMAV